MSDEPLRMSVDDDMLSDWLDHPTAYGAFEGDYINDWMIFTSTEPLSADIAVRFNELIFIGKQIEIDQESFITSLCKLRDAAQENNDKAAIQALHDIVPTFIKPEEFNKKVFFVANAS